KVIESIAMEQRGLILVTGTTGSGKSTTLAAMIDYINSNRTCHIMTIEDPIEFLIRDPRSIVNQREIGLEPSTLPTPGQAPRRPPGGGAADPGEHTPPPPRPRPRPPCEAPPPPPPPQENNHPHLLVAPAIPAEAGADPARVDPQGGDLPAPGPARRRE